MTKIGKDKCAVSFDKYAWNKISRQKYGRVMKVRGNKKK